MKDDYEIKFWKDWLNADPMKRMELAKGLPVFKMSLKMKNTKITNTCVWDAKVAEQL